jgi:conjugal transfer mating pair stabilization protein TraN
MRSQITCQDFKVKKREAGLLAGTYTHRVGMSARVENNCRAPLVNIHIDQGHRKNNKNKLRGVWVVLNVEYRLEPKIQDNWVSSCPVIAERVKAGLCQYSNSRCVLGPKTVPINGMDVTRTCWKMEDSYTCGSHFQKNTCSVLKDKGCEQIGTECSTLIQGLCVEYKNTYHCPLKKCAANDNIVCGGALFCLDGRCSQPIDPQDSNFTESVARFSAVGEAVNPIPTQMDETTPFIFKGKVAKCRKYGFGFSDCCKEGGWGQDIGLSHCNTEEVFLGKSRERGVAIKVGSKRGQKLTQQRFDVFCVFDSKLAKIIQLQGRKGQLQMGMGSGKHPDCRGLSTAEFSRINLNVMDFREVLQEVEANFKNKAGLEPHQKIAEKIKDFYEAGVPYAP